MSVIQTSNTCSTLLDQSYYRGAPHLNFVWVLHPTNMAGALYLCPLSVFFTDRKKSPNKFRMICNSVQVGENNNLGQVTVHGLQFEVHSFLPDGLPAGGGQAGMFEVGFTVLNQQRATSNQQLSVRGSQFEVHSWVHGHNNLTI